jgi:hypothetical protein
VLRLCYRLTAIESLCYGSIISATDPVRKRDYLNHALCQGDYLQSSMMRITDRSSQSS